MQSTWKSGGQNVSKKCLTYAIVELKWNSLIDESICKSVKVVNKCFTVILWVVQTKQSFFEWCHILQALFPNS